MPPHFTNPLFQRFEIDAVPLDRDVYLMDERWIPAWEKAYLRLFEGGDFENVGVISRAAVNRATPEALEIAWYPNIMDRFHEVVVVLPRDAFVTCVDVYDYDEKPHIFVKDDWHERLHLRPYSAFAFIDAIGVKDAITTGRLSGNKLVALRDRIDVIAAETPSVAFVSFADSLLLKVNWTVGQYDSHVSYTYEPEALIRLFPKVATAYRDILNMPVYATITQGANEYADSSLIHHSQAGNHVSLNCLGLPFAQLLAIDEAAREAIRSEHHDPYALYVDDLFFHSLRFKNGFDKHALPHSSYKAPMSTTPGQYYCASVEDILDNLETAPSTFRWKKGKI